MSMYVLYFYPLYNDILYFRIVRIWLMHTKKGRKKAKNWMQNKLERNVVTGPIPNPWVILLKMTIQIKEFRGKGPKEKQRYTFQFQTVNNLDNLAAIRSRQSVRISLEDIENRAVYLQNRVQEQRFIKLTYSFKKITLLSSRGSSFGKIGALWVPKICIVVSHNKNFCFLFLLSSMGGGAESHDEFWTLLCSPSPKQRLEGSKGYKKFIL